MLDHRQWPVGGEIGVDEERLVLSLFQGGQEAVEAGGARVHDQRLRRRGGAGRVDPGQRAHAAQVEVAVGEGGSAPGDLVEELQAGHLAVALGRGLRHPQRPRLAHDHQVIAHQGGEAVAGAAVAPDRLAGGGVDAGEDLAVHAVQVAVVVDGLHVGALDRAAGPKLGDAIGVGLLDLQHH